MEITLGNRIIHIFRWSCIPHLLAVSCVNSISTVDGLHAELANTPVLESNYQLSLFGFQKPRAPLEQTCAHVKKVQAAQSQGVVTRH